MNHFFKVKTLEDVMGMVGRFSAMPTETVTLPQASGRILGQDIVAHQDLPGFRRSTMDGYAVQSAATFGASEANPAWLKVAGTIAMGETPCFSLTSDEAAPISTGGMLPDGADSVVMVEHTEAVDAATVEIYKSVAPLQHVVDSAEDYRQGQEILKAGTRIRPQESGVLAALGKTHVTVFKQTTVAIISTGDEIVPVEETPAPGRIRDMNSHTLAGLISEAGAIPLQLGIVKDNRDDLFDACSRAVAMADMVLISGGSSVGMRDFTVEVLSDLVDTELLVHGISISPGKPTILARSGNKPVWGLPGHVVSAMVVFKVVVLPFLRKRMGENAWASPGALLPAILTRNVASAQGRTDFIRVAIQEKEGHLYAAPVLGKSGLIRTMVMAQGLVEIGENVEGLDKGAVVNVRCM
ncbi:molybdopterin molybdochelatase [Desulfocicer vacuolatum DSM 3385]|uniref:Molybdopterin molybdenumtransferase n=1 Tax=Desulfocicer vacuolatum DSM 3385 TaxID=1121400 RepID=A0A1W2CX12_9BACT|nr:gephyrin-like molybdotransferase Glp [Desulfocicer vacuolatum]SMC89730.1 molybdopterin molybdochelatase [Desulfocicer vacuolatum DSM 3385]